MATHRLYCGHDDCQEFFDSEDNFRPALCPKCDRVERWTPTPPYKLTKQDERFLRSLHIESKTAIAEDENIDDDGA